MGVATFAADIAAVLQHGGVSVTIGDVNGYGSLKQRDAIDTNEGIGAQVRVTTLVVPTDVFSLSKGASATVDGQSYKIRSWAPEDNGQLTRIILTRAS